MPQSLSRILIHLVFSTRYRAPVLSAEIQAELHPYLGGILKRTDCLPIQIGGAPDHVHLLFALARTRSMAQVVEGLKANSSRWLKHSGLPGFAWQTGYGAFSVSHSSAGAVARYIREQERHHRGRSYQDELRALLQRHRLEFDEQRLWD